MKLNKITIIHISIFFIFYITLIIGFLFNEDSAGGAITDYIVHSTLKDFFVKDTLYGLKNYLDLSDQGGVHSPIFLIFLKYLLFYNETIGRFFFLNLSVLIPFIFFITLKKKIQKYYFPIFYLSNFFFISPYFRSTAIWPGDENLAILFFIFSIFFYISFTNSVNNNHRIKSMVCNIFLLAIASYFRPIYALFSIFFFYEFVLKDFKLNFFLIYSLLSAALSFPAFYYIFILKVTFFYDQAGSFNFINSFALTYTALLFYLIPFIFFSIKSFNFFKLNFIYIFLTIVLSIIVFIFFNYQSATGGGILYMLQNLFFKGNFVFAIIFAVAFYFSNLLLEINKIKNFILIFILLFFEPDNQFYMETFDPLFLICFFLLFDTKTLNIFFDSDIYKKINYLFIYLFLFFIIKITNLYLL